MHSMQTKPLMKGEVLMPKCTSTIFAFLNITNLNIIAFLFCDATWSNKSVGACAARVRCPCAFPSRLRLVPKTEHHPHWHLLAVRVTRTRTLGARHSSRPWAGRFTDIRT